MACGVGIDPAATGFTQDPRHSIEHAGSGSDVHPRIAEKEDIGVRGVDESLYIRGGIVFRIDDIHISHCRFALSLRCDEGTRRIDKRVILLAKRGASRPPYGRMTMTPAIRFALRNSPNSCSTTRLWLSDACRMRML